MKKEHENPVQGSEQKRSGRPIDENVEITIDVLSGIEYLQHYGDTFLEHCDRIDSLVWDMVKDGNELRTAEEKLLLLDFNKQLKSIIEKFRIPE